MHTNALGVKIASISHRLHLDWRSVIFTKICRGQANHNLLVKCMPDVHFEKVRRLSRLLLQENMLKMEGDHVGEIGRCCSSPKSITIVGKMHLRQREICATSC